MALPASGPISISAIVTEMSVVTELTPPYSLRGLSNVAGKSIPDSLNEFHGYSAGGGKG